MTNTPHDPENPAAFVPGMDDTAERPAVRDGGSAAPQGDPVPYARAGARRAEKSKLPGLLAVVVALAVLVGGGWFLWGKASDFLDSGSGDDYSTGAYGDAVTFEVSQGDTLAQIGRNLKADGVVLSVDAFVAATQSNPEAAGIQVGFYQLNKSMPAADALNVLVDPANIVTTTVTIREGLQARAIVDVLAKETGIKKARFQAALEDPEAIGLPAYANGNPEGYLFPATYAFGPKDKAVDMIKAMVDRWKQAVADNDIEATAKAMGYTPEEIMTVASLIQAEGRGDDMPKVGRVIYNRIENPGTAGTVGRLEIDASVLYALQRDGNSHLLLAEIDSTDSPYNTYKHTGLPPGPIGSPGDDAIQAALNPAEGDWYYYVTVNLATGETKFAENYDQFLTFKREYQDYCATQSDRC